MSKANDFELFFKLVQLKNIDKELKIINFYDGLDYVKNAKKIIKLLNKIPYEFKIISSFISKNIKEKLSSDYIIETSSCKFKSITIEINPDDLCKFENIDYINKYFKIKKYKENILFLEKR